MERDGHQNTNARLQSINTTGEGAPQGYYIVALDTFILGLIGILGICIQLKFPNGSPYATVYGTRLMNLFTIETCIYIVSLILMAILADHNNADLEDLMNTVSLLLGTLPLILELLVLIKPFGWIVLFVWSMCLLCFLRKYYQSLNTLCESAIAHLVQDFGEFSQTLIDWHGRLMGSNAITAPGRAYQKLKDLIIRNDGRVTEHEAQNQNRTNEVPV